MAKSLTAIDLFSGCGGLTQGLKSAGYRVLSAIEIDALAANTYKLNHPEVKLYIEDIRKHDVKKLKQSLCLEPGQLDLLAGCPPCQGFSSMRTMNGKVNALDGRNYLLHQISRFADELQPRMIMMENVPGLQSRPELNSLVLNLKAMGYFVSVEVLNAADFGVAQHRRRLILLASKLFKPEFPISNSRRKSVQEAFGDLPVRDMDPLQNYTETRQERIKQIISSIPQDGGSRTELPEDLWLDCHKKGGGFKDVYGRMSWSKPSNTITCGCINPSKGRFLHPTENRAITLREASLLQSFPPDYKFDTSRGRYAIAQMIGNALPPEFINAQASQMKKMLMKVRYEKAITR